MVCFDPSNKFFYLRDHLGNNRVDVTADGGGVCQAMDYCPFGLAMGSSYLPGQQRWLFGGKELDRISGLDLLDFEARAYDPSTGRFRQPDPLAEKYKSLSQYLYCAVNPVVNTDPTGMLIVFEKNASEKFKSQFNEAKTYLKGTVAAENIAYIENSTEFVVTLVDNTGTGKTQFVSDNTIRWDPTMAIYTTNAYLLTPAELLAHEMDHARRYYTDPEGMDKDSTEGSSESYNTKEEERVISGSEAKTAHQLGKLPTNSQPREDHGGIRYKVDSVSVEEDEMSGATLRVPNTPSSKN